MSSPGTPDPKLEPNQPAGIGAPGIGSKPESPLPTPTEEKKPEPQPEAESDLTADKPKDAAKADAAPVEYKITAPEGVQLDEGLTTKATDIAKKHGVPPEALQDLANLYFDQAKAASESVVAENRKAWDDLQGQWKKNLDSDKELGGTRAKDAQVLIGRAMDEYGSDEARQAFDLTGAGNNPAVVRMIYRMAKALSEGGIVAGSKPVSKTRTPGEVLYGTKET